MVRSTCPVSDLGRLLVFVLASLLFVSAYANPLITLTKELFAPGDPIHIKVSGLPGNRTDWLTLVPADAPVTSYGEWVYTNGDREGSWTFTAPAHTGEYEVRVIIGDPAGDALGAKLPVKVVNTKRGEAKAVLTPGVWQGTARCDAGDVHVTVSTDVHPFKGNADLAAARVDFSWSRNGPSFARSYVSLSKVQAQALTMLKQWSYRPLDLSGLTGERMQRIPLYISADLQTLEAPTFGACESLTMSKVPNLHLTGGIESATLLPRLYEGTIGCYGGPATHAVKLTVAPSGARSFDGTIELRSATDTQGSELAAFRAIGEFDPVAGSVTVIGDKWLKEIPGVTKFDFFAALRDNGRRLVGQSGIASCGVIDLRVPGTDPADSIRHPRGTTTILEWDTPEACVALIDWARQSRRENNDKSVYTSLTTAQLRQIGIGLFADERFLPFFHKPFAQLTAGERNHVDRIAQSCKFQQHFAHDMGDSGALRFVQGVFADSSAGPWLELKSFQVLRKRLSVEMAALAERGVGEADIAPLRDELAGLAERFKVLWKSDLREARLLLESKLDTAEGVMIERLETDIDRLPNAWFAFDSERTLRNQIEWLAADRSTDRLALTHRLNRRFSAISDHLLNGIALRFADAPAGTSTLMDLRIAVETNWPKLLRFVDTAGPGFRALLATFEKSADAALPDFEKRVSKMIVADAPFEKRLVQYETAIHAYALLVPSQREFAGAFESYDRLLRQLRPTPTRKDLVAADGSPTEFGLKDAIRRRLERHGRIADIIVDTAYGIRSDFAANLVSVVAVSDMVCRAARHKGWYECDFVMQDVRSSAPMVGELLRGSPGRVHVVFTDMRWRVVGS